MVALLIMVIAIGSFIFAVVLLWKSRRYSTHINLIRRAVPIRASELGSTYPGQVVAVSGNPESERPLVSFQSETPCVYYEYDVIRHFQTRSRRVIEGGDSVSRLVSRRETVAHEEESVPFRVSDGSGQIGVNPDGALFEALNVLDRVEPVTDKNKNGLPGQRMNNTTGRGLTAEYLIKENAIPTSQPVYVVGPVNERGQIERNRSHGVIVSHRPESELRDEWSSHSRQRSFGCCGATLFGILALAAGTALTAMSVV